MSLTTNPIKILLVDDHQLFNDGLKSLLSTEQNLEIVGQVYESRNVLYEIQRLNPQLIFLDINLPEQNGIELSKIILKDFQNVKIIFLTMYADEQMLKEAKKLEVHGYILKNSSKKELLLGIETVMNGKQYFDAKIHKSAQDESNKDDLSKKFALTEREKEIIAYVKAGLDSYQIADKMSLSYLTIKTHRRNIHFKLGTTSTPELIRFANENSL
ncbi:MAG: response regulator transcription factor [Arcicella sp.]|jgi:DNA-binding NarL/FixJ family response regulator|nr:response regulator transcription factor [Arcicella sp.]